MVRKTRFRLLCPVGALMAAALVPLAFAQAQEPMQFGCDAPTGKTCYFSIQFASGGVRSFALPSGRKTVVSGVTAGRDAYLVSLDAPNLGDLNRCRQLNSMGRSCQRKAVDPSYND